MTGWDEHSGHEPRPATPDAAGSGTPAGPPPSGPAAADAAPGPGTVGPWWATPGVVPAPGFPAPPGPAGYSPGSLPPGAAAGPGAPHPPPAGSSTPPGPGAAYPPAAGHPPGSGYPTGAGHPAGVGFPPSPAYPPPGAVGRAPGPQPVRGLGIAVQVLMAVGLVVGVVELVAAWGLARLIDRLLDPRNTVTEAEADRADQFQQATATVSLVCFLATAVVFLIWFHRLRVNAGWWAPHRQRRGPGWAIGGWFVPVVNLWFPLTTAQDVLAGSRPTADRSGTGKLTLWWAAWIANFVVGLAYRGLARDARTIDEYATVAGLGVFLSVLDLVLTVLAILVVRMLTGLQERRLAADGRPV